MANFGVDKSDAFKIVSKQLALVAKWLRQWTQDLHIFRAGSNPTFFLSVHFKFSFLDFSGSSARIFMNNTSLERYSPEDYEYYRILIK